MSRPLTTVTRGVPGLGTGLRYGRHQNGLTYTTGPPISSVWCKVFNIDL